MRAGHLGHKQRAFCAWFAPPLQRVCFVGGDVSDASLRLSPHRKSVSPMTSSSNASLSSGPARNSTATILAVGAAGDFASVECAFVIGRVRRRCTMTLPMSSADIHQ
jgi:hypothetical protein